MTRCSTGRSTQKYSRNGGDTDLSSVLTAQGDIIYADSNIEASNVSIGSTIGHVLTITSPGEVGWQAASISGGSVGTLQGVTVNGPSTTQHIILSNPTTSLTADSNIIVSGNVTAGSYLGNGTGLTGVALSSDLVSNVIRISSLEVDLDDNSSRINSLEQSNINQFSNLVSNSSRISDLETATIISNSSGITSGFTAGDFIYASANNTLSKFGIGANNRVLKVVSGAPSWEPDIVQNWSTDGNKLYYTSGPVGISNVSELTTQTVQIGANVVINDSASNKVIVSGNVYVSQDMTVIDNIFCNKITAAEQLRVKKQVVAKERPQTTKVIII